MTWTKRTPPSTSYTERTKADIVYLWGADYLPWAADAYPWLKENTSTEYSRRSDITTNYTKRTKP